MDPKVWWGITTGLGLLIALVSYLLKRSITQMERRDEEHDKAIKELDTKLNQTIKEMPYLYPLREDHIRAMASIERRLDKITDLLQGQGGGKQ